MAPSGGSSHQPQHRGLMLALVGGLLAVGLFGWLATRGGSVDSKDDGTALDSVLSALTQRGGGNRAPERSDDGSATTAASSPGVISGTPSILAANSLALNGQTIVLFALYVPPREATCLVTGQTWPCGEYALNALTGIIGHARQVICRPQGHDPLGRVVAVCEADGKDIAADLLRGGWALANPSLARSYSMIQTSAQIAHVGVFRGTFDERQFVGY